MACDDVDDTEIVKQLHPAYFVFSCCNYCLYASVCYFATIRMRTLLARTAIAQPSDSPPSLSWEFSEAICERSFATQSE